MTKFNVNYVEDKNLINKAFEYNTKLLFGNDTTIYNNMGNLFHSRVSKITVSPYGTITNELNGTNTGLCTYNTDNTCSIDSYGIVNAPESEHKGMLHSMIHEQNHALTSYIPEIYSKYTNGLQTNSTYKANLYGIIASIDLIDYNSNYEFYGYMFNETMMDIYSSMAIIGFDGGHGTDTVDDVLTTNYRMWKEFESGYSIFSSITRLFIAAFSNNPYIKYQELIDNGIGILNIKTENKNNEKVFANDFIYGIICDPMHIEREYDKYVGAGEYKKLATSIDLMFNKYLKGDQNHMMPETVKLTMKEIANFINKKNAAQFNAGNYDVVTINLITSNFNAIWNSLQREYRAFYTKAEIDDILDNADEDYRSAATIENNGRQLVKTRNNKF